MQANQNMFIQAKLVKYKTEAAEGGSLVEELSDQSRLDQETIRGLRDNIEELRQTAQTDKVMCRVCMVYVMLLTMVGGGKMY